MPPPGSQHKEIGKAVAPSFRLFPAGLWLGAQGPDPLECGRHEAGVPKARKKVSEPTAAAHFLLDLRGCICEVFGVCGRQSGGKQLRQKKTKALYLIPVSSNVIMPVPRLGQERNP